MTREKDGASATSCSASKERKEATEQEVTGGNR